MCRIGFEVDCGALFELNGALYLVQMEPELRTLVLKKIVFSFYHLIHQRYQAWDRFLLCVVNFFFVSFDSSTLSGLGSFPHQRYRSLLAVSSQIPRTLCCLFVRLKMSSMLLDKWRKEGSSPALHTSDGR